MRTYLVVKEYALLGLTFAILGGAACVGALIETWGDVGQWARDLDLPWPR
jgi:hypothetical protein